MNPNVKPSFPKLNRKVSALELKKTGWSYMGSKRIFACLAYGQTVKSQSERIGIETQDGHVSNKVSALEFKTQDGHVSSKVGALEGLHGVTPTCAYAL